MFKGTLTLANWTVPSVCPLKYLDYLASVSAPVLCGTLPRHGTVGTGVLVVGTVSHMCEQARLPTQRAKGSINHANRSLMPAINLDTCKDGLF